MTCFLGIATLVKPPVINIQIIQFRPNQKKVCNHRFLVIDVNSDNFVGNLVRPKSIEINDFLWMNAFESLHCCNPKIYLAIGYKKALNRKD